MSILNLTITNPFILILISFVLGLFISLVCTLTSKCTRNMTLSLMVLPTIVCAALLAINGNLGTSIAILGVFSLVRFRSLPGSSRDIINIFYAMTCGLLVSTTYVSTAIGIVLLIGILLIVVSKIYKEKTQNEHTLKILIAENVGFDNLFDDIFNNYFDKYELDRVKTSNMGTMFELTYKVIPKTNISTKKILDDIRQLNGNLNISYLTTTITHEEL